MLTTVTRRYAFEAAHFLPHVPSTHKCKRMHGHNYEVEIEVEGKPAESGFIIDFFTLDKIVQPLVDMIDHRILNDQAGLENPTAELIGVWFAQRVQSALDALDGLARRTYLVGSVKVLETKDCWATVWPSLKATGEE